MNQATEHEDSREEHKLDEVDEAESDTGDKVDAGADGKQYVGDTSSRG